MGIAGFGATVYADYKDDGKIFNGSISVNDYIANTFVSAALGALAGGIIHTLAPTIGGFLGSSFTLGSYALAGGEIITMTVSGTQILGGTLAASLGIALFARTSKSGGYYGEGWPGDPHKPTHIHFRGNGTDIRIGKDGNPLPKEPNLSSQQRKALRKLWKEFVEMFNSWG